VIIQSQYKLNKMKRKKFWTSVTAALFLAVFTSSCKKDKYVPIAGVCPTVQSTDPANLATGVPRNKVIIITFNEKMDPATITQQSFILSQGATKIAGTLMYDGTTPTMSFAPTVYLTANTTYTGRVTSAVKDLMGNALQTDYLWTFTTGVIIKLDTDPPTVVITDPANNATGVVLNKIITAKFSEQMNPWTINSSSFLIKQGGTAIAGTVTYNGITAYFTPAANLLPGATYMATITTAAKDFDGNSLSNDYTWSFSTSASTTALLPVIIATNPQNNAANVALNAFVTATFNEAMDPATLTNATFLLKTGGVTVAGSVSYAGTTASFTPSSNLLQGAAYTATITTGAKDLSGNPIASDYIWTFYTMATATVAPAVDLKTVGRFGIIAGVGVSNNAGFSEIHDMDVGISPGVRSSITGFPPAVVINGTIFASDDIAPPGVAAMLTQAKQDLTDAYLFAEAAVSPAPATVNGDIGGQTLAPGIYKSTSTLLIQSGDLTLDAQGNPDAFWIFQIASAFTTVGGAGGNVILAGGAQAKNVFWQTGSSATIGDFTSFKGNVLALTSITMNSGAVATGRMLCRNGAVVLTSTNLIYKP
jgi:hypothetical protein